ncbi:MAG: zinc-binding dehydrogenase [Bacilli bacterium]
MKAVVIHEHGDPDVLKYEHIPEPVVGEKDVLVRVRVVGINFNDIWARKGLPGLRFRLPHIPGTDAVGEVAEVGHNVSHLKVGDRVLVNPLISCGECVDCRASNEYFCKEFKVWGFQTGPLDGGCAEYIRLPERNLAIIPEQYSFEEMACLPACFGTAWHMLIGRAKIQSGESVLVWGASGGLGTMAVQIVKMFGGIAIAVAGSNEKLETAKCLGADYLINYRTENVLRRVRRITGMEGVDIVFEHTGVDTWETSIKSLKLGGRLVTCGNTTGFDAKLDLRLLFWRQLSLLGCHVGTGEEFLEWYEYLNNNKVQSVISKIFPFSEAAEAHRVFESGNKVGKLLLVPS